MDREAGEKLCAEEPDPEPIAVLLPSDLIDKDTMTGHYSDEIRKLEWFIPNTARSNAATVLLLSLLKTVPDIGDVLSLTILYEIHDISRFATHQRFASYARLIKPEKTSVGKSAGVGGKKIGNHHLKWALSEATVLILDKSEPAQRYLKRQLKEGSKPRALSTIVLPQLELEFCSEGVNEYPGPKRLPHPIQTVLVHRNS